MEQLVGLLQQDLLFLVHLLVLVGQIYVVPMLLL
jgi:hypothetical protein